MRIGMVVGFVALLGAAVKVTQWSSQNGITTDQQQKQTVAKWTDPCAPAAPAPAPVNPCAPAPAPPVVAPVNPCAPAATTTAPAVDLCATPINGLFHKPTLSCCLPTCGAFCGAANCQTAPVGRSNCCTRTFDKLCGNPGVVAPCKIPKTVAGVVRLIANPAKNFNSNPKSIDAVVAALAQLLGVPKSSITAALDADGNGRRLIAGTNVNYVLRLHPNSAITPATVASKSGSMKQVLQGHLDALGVATTVAYAELPPPTEFHPTEGSGASTTKALPTLTVGEPEPEME